MPFTAVAERPHPDAVVIGAGVVGLGVARRLAAAGLRVAALDRGAPGREASYAAAGMLCPRLEFDSSSQLGRLGCQSLTLYPAFTAELEAESGRSIDLRLNGVLRPLLPETAQASAPEPEATSPRSDAVRWVERPELRELEPGLDPAIERAIFHEGEGSVDNRALVDALREACARRGVDVRVGVRVMRVLEGTSRVRGVATEGGEVAAPIVVNAAGAWAGLVPGPGAPLAVRPIKGQMLRLDRSAIPGARLEHTVYCHAAYVVPRTDGRVVVGTTVEDCGYDKTVDDGAIERLRQGAVRLVPGLAAAPVRETWAGLRPKGPTEAPIVGRWGIDGYFVAVGHYRNGILLAPWTAEEIARSVLEEE
jgi:glycine oxidase